MTTDKARGAVDPAVLAHLKERLAGFNSDDLTSSGDVYGLELTRAERNVLRVVLAENERMRETAVNFERRLRHAYRTVFVDRYWSTAVTNGVTASEIESLAEQYAARLIAEEAEADTWVPPQFALDSARYFASGRCRICGVQAGRNHMFMCGNGAYDREQQAAHSEGADRA